MKRLIRQLKWRGIVMGAFLIIGCYTLVWGAGNVSTTIQDDGFFVGIGTTSPAAKLHVANNLGGVSFRFDKASGTGGMDFATSGAIKWLIVHEADDSLTINNVFGGGNVIHMTPSGNVGMGTGSPTTKLHVSGNVQVDGNLAAKYQDIAEWVQASEPLPPGTVVVVDPQGHNQVLLASQSYDTRVAGVVSDRPGLLLGEAGPDKVKVAQSGRVKVKVDASYGPIAVGDLLVTSATPGHAMRSTPLNLGETLIHRPGTLLGKALESLEGEQGEILVLLTLQ
jgi:hypothetical protein